MTIKEQVHQLASQIEATIRAYQNAAEILSQVAKTIPAEAINAPTKEATKLLARHGFCVVHREQLDAAIGVIQAASENPHEDEAERLFHLIAYLKGQRAFADWSPV